MSGVIEIEARDYDYDYGGSRAKPQQNAKMLPTPEKRRKPIYIYP